MKHEHKHEIQELRRGEVPEGWDAGRWRERLRYLAEACRVVAPELSLKWGEWAGAVVVRRNE